MKKLNLRKLSKKQITILITSFCVVVVSVFAIGMVIVVESASDDKVMDKKTSSIKNKNKKDDSSNDKKNTDDKKEDGKVEEKIADTNVIVDTNNGTSTNINTGNTNDGSTNGSGNVAPTPPPPSKVCSAPNVLFDNLPCDTLLPQYSMDGKGVGNSGLTFATKDQAIVYAEGQWMNENSPWYMFGYECWTIQVNDGSVVWTTNFY